MLLAASGMVATGAFAWFGASQAKAVTYYFTGGAAGTGNSIFASSGSNSNTVDGVYNASGGNPGSTTTSYVIDSTDNTSSGVYIGGGTSTTGTLALNYTTTFQSLTFGNASSPTQLPTTLFLDDTLAGGTTSYTLTLNGGTGTTGGTDLLATTANVGTNIEIRGSNASSVSSPTSASILMKLVLGSSGNFNVSNANALLRLDVPIANAAGGAYGITKTGAGTLYLYNTGSTFTGGVNVASGTIELYSGGSLGAAPATASTQLLFSGNSTFLISTNVGFGSTRGMTINSGVTASFDYGGTSVTISGPVNGGGSLTKIDTGNIILGGGVSYSGDTIVSAGTLTINSAGTYGGITSVASGATLALGASGTLPSTTALTLNGATFSTSNAGGGSAVASTTIAAGVSSISVANLSTGSLAIGLGALGRTGTGTADIVLPTVGSVTTTTPNATFNAVQGGILAPFVTVNNGAAFATSAAPGNGTTAGAITPLTAASPSSSSNYSTGTTGTDFQAATSGTFTNSTINSLRFDTASATATTNGALTVASGGILATAGSGTGMIAGGTLTAGSTSELIFHQYNTAAPLIVTSSIIDGAAATSLTKVGPGTLILDGANTFTGPTSVNAGTLQVGNSDAAGTLGSATANVSSGATLALSRSDSNTVTTPIAGAGRVLVNGGGTTVLSPTGTGGSNFYTGGTNITSGTLAISTTNALGTTASLTTVNGGTLFFTGSVQTGTSRNFAIGASGGTISYNGPGGVFLNGLVSGTGLLTKAGSGIVAIEDTSNSNSGGIDIVAGQLQIGSNGCIVASTTTTIETNGTLGLNAANEVNYSSSQSITGTKIFAFNGSGSQISSNTGETWSIAGMLTNGTGGPGTLNKVGTGALYLTNNNNTYSGGTNINAGLLRANSTINSSTGSGPVVVNSGGTLAGGGVVSGLVTVNSGGTIGAGTSGTGIGTLNTSGGQVWNAGGAFLSKFNASTPSSTATAQTNDRLLMSTLTIDPSASLSTPFSISLSNTSTAVTIVDNLTKIILATNNDPTGSNPFNLSSPTARFSSLANLQAALSLNVGAAFTAPSGYVAQLDTQIDGTGYDLIVDFAATPEPTSLLLLGVAAAPLAVGRRRQRAPK